MKKVFAAGELLIDFMGARPDVSMKDCDTFIKKAGGAPPNALAALCKLGGKGYLASRVGQDPFGDFLIEECEKYGIDLSMVTKDPSHFTTVAFVSLTSSGERDFIFAKGAHSYIAYDDINEDILRDCEIFHFGAATGLLDSKTHETYDLLLDYARKNNKLISFDANYRYDFWKQDTNLFINRANEYISKSHLIKFSEEEAFVLSGKNDIYEAGQFFVDLGTTLVLITLSEKGTLVYMKDFNEIIPSIKVDCIDSTGAGDAFIGAFLYQVSLRDDVEDIFNDKSLLKKAVAYANKAGAICCKSLGAMESMPTAKEMDLDI